MKKMKLLVLFFSLILSAKSCTKKEEIETIIPTPSVSTQKLYFNGKIYTVNDKQPWAEAILINENKIVFVGSNIEAEKKADETVNKIDLKRKSNITRFS